MTEQIVVVDYDERWPAWFARLHDRIWPAVAMHAVRIDHIGSTSVPGIAAKPIIDMDIVVASESNVRPVIEAVRTIGYEWRGDLGVEGRQAFFQPDGDIAHHLYLVVEDSKAHLDHWLLRDLLRREHGARDRYGALKRANVELAAGDMDVYVAAKADYVAELLTRARLEAGLPPAEYWRPDSEGGDQ